MKRTFLSRLAIFLTVLFVPLSAADAADLVYKSPAPPTGSWTGFYFGIDGGYGWNQRTGDRYCINPAGVLFGTGCSPNEVSSVFSPSGGLVGGEAGYNWQTGVVVTGMETDIQWSGIRASTVVPIATAIPGGTYTATDNLSWFGTTRGRIGFLATPQLLAYATGGIIYGRENVSALTTPGNGFLYPSAASTTRAGGVVGAGLEYAFAANFSAKIEGLYYDMGTLTTTFACPAGATTCAAGYTEGGNFAVRGAILRGGLNLHFN